MEESNKEESNQLEDEFQKIDREPTKYFRRHRLKLLSYSYCSTAKKIGIL